MKYKKLFNSKIAKGLVSLVTIVMLLSSILATSIFYQNNITGNVVREISTDTKSITIQIKEVNDIKDLSQLNEGWYEIRNGFVFYMDTFNSYAPLYIRVRNAEQQSGLLVVDEDGTVSLDTNINKLTEKEIVNENEELIEGEVTGNVISEISGFAAKPKYQSPKPYVNPFYYKVIQDTIKKNNLKVTPEQVYALCKAEACARAANVQMQVPEVRGNKPILLEQLKNPDPKTEELAKKERERISTAYNIPESAIRIEVRGGTKREFLSRSIGEMQLNELYYPADVLRDPAKNLEAGTKHFNYNYVKCSEDFPCGIACYNTGCEKVGVLERTYAYAASILGGVIPEGFRSHTVRLVTVSEEYYAELIGQDVQSILAKLTTTAKAEAVPPRTAQADATQKLLPRPALEDANNGDTVYLNGIPYRFNDVVSDGRSYWLSSFDKIGDSIKVPLKDPRLSISPPAFSNAEEFAKSNFARTGRPYAVDEDGKVRDGTLVIAQLVGKAREDYAGKDFQVEISVPPSSIVTRGPDIALYRIVELVSARKPGDTAIARAPLKVQTDDDGTILKIYGLPPDYVDETYYSSERIVDQVGGESVRFIRGRIYKVGFEYYLLPEDSLVPISVHFDGKAYFWKNPDNGGLYMHVSGQQLKTQDEYGVILNSLHDPTFYQALAQVNKKEEEDSRKLGEEATRRELARVQERVQDYTDDIFEQIDPKRLKQLFPNPDATRETVEGLAQNSEQDLEYSAYLRELNLQLQREAEEALKKAREQEIEYLNAYKRALDEELRAADEFKRQQEAQQKRESPVMGALRQAGATLYQLANAQASNYQRAGIINGYLVGKGISNIFILDSSGVYAGEVDSQGNLHLSSTANQDEINRIIEAARSQGFDIPPKLVVRKIPTTERAERAFAEDATDGPTPGGEARPTPASPVADTGEEEEPFVSAAGPSGPAPARETALPAPESRAAAKPPVTERSLTVVPSFCASQSAGGKSPFCSELERKRDEELRKMALERQRLKIEEKIRVAKETKSYDAEESSLGQFLGVQITGGMTQFEYEQAILYAAKQKGEFTIGEDKYYFKINNDEVGLEALQLKRVRDFWLDATVSKTDAEGIMAVAIEEQKKQAATRETAPAAPALKEEQPPKIENIVYYDAPRISIDGEVAEKIGDTTAGPLLYGTKEGVYYLVYPGNSYESVTISVQLIQHPQFHVVTTQDGREFRVELSQSAKAALPARPEPRTPLPVTQYDLSSIDDLGTLGTGNYYLTQDGDIQYTGEFDGVSQFNPTIKKINPYAISQFAGQTFEVNSLGDVTFQNNVQIRQASTRSGLIITAPDETRKIDHTIIYPNGKGQVVFVNGDSKDVTVQDGSYGIEFMVGQQVVLTEYYDESGATPVIRPIIQVAAGGATPTSGVPTARGGEVQPTGGPTPPGGGGAGPTGPAQSGGASVLLPPQHQNKGFKQVNPAEVSKFTEMAGIITGSNLAKDVKAVFSNPAGEVLLLMKDDRVVPYAPPKPEPLKASDITIIDPKKAESFNTQQKLNQLADALWGIGYPNSEIEKIHQNNLDAIMTAQMYLGFKGKNIDGFSINGLVDDKTLGKASTTKQQLPPNPTLRAVYDGTGDIIGYHNPVAETGVVEHTFLTGKKEYVIYRGTHQGMQYWARFVPLDIPPAPSKVVESTKELSSLGQGLYYIDRGDVYLWSEVDGASIPTFIQVKNEKEQNGIVRIDASGNLEFSAPLGTAPSAPPGAVRQAQGSGPTPPGGGGAGPTVTGPSEGGGDTPQPPRTTSAPIPQVTKQGEDYSIGGVKATKKEDADGAVYYEANVNGRLFEFHPDVLPENRLVVKQDDGTYQYVNTLPQQQAPAERPAGADALPAAVTSSPFPTPILAGLPPGYQFGLETKTGIIPGISAPGTSVGGVAPTLPSKPGEAPLIEWHQLENPITKKHVFVGIYKDPATGLDYVRVDKLKDVTDAQGKVVGRVEDVKGTPVPIHPSHRVGVDTEHWLGDPTAMPLGEGGARSAKCDAGSCTASDTFRVLNEKTKVHENTKTVQNTIFTAGTRTGETETVKREGLDKKDPKTTSTTTLLDKSQKVIVYKGKDELNANIESVTYSAGGKTLQLDRETYNQLDRETYNQIPTSVKRDALFREAAIAGITGLTRELIVVDDENGRITIGNKAGTHILATPNAQILTKEGDQVKSFVDLSKPNEPTRSIFIEGIVKEVGGVPIPDAGTVENVYDRKGDFTLRREYTSSALGGEEGAGPTVQSVIESRYFKKDGEVTRIDISIGIRDLTNKQTTAITTLQTREVKEPGPTQGYIEVKSGTGTAYIDPRIFTNDVLVPVQRDGKTELMDLSRLKDCTGGPCVITILAGGDQFGQKFKKATVDVSEDNLKTGKEAEKIKKEARKAHEALRPVGFGQQKSQKFFAEVQHIFTEFQGLGYFATFFFDEDSLLQWRENIDRFFATYYLGTEYWSSAICGSYLDGEDEGIAYAETPQGLSQIGAHIEATRSEPLSTDKGREFIYKITFNIRNGDYDKDPRAPEEMHINVVLKGDRTVTLFKQEQTVKRGSSFGRLGRNAIAQYSTAFYNQICLTFDKVPFRWKLDNNELCNTIQGSSGAATTVSTSSTTTTSSGGGTGGGEGEFNEI